MAVSGSTDFSMTRNDIVEDALDILGVGTEGEPISAAEMAKASRRLNAMVKAWQAEGLHIWTYAEGSLTLVAAQQSYVMGTGGDFTTRPLRIRQVRFRDASGYDTELEHIGREEYFAFSDKGTASRPTAFYYDPGRDSGTLYIWPTLGASDSGTLRFTYSRTIQDFDTAADTPDFPQEWLEALSYNLALRLAPSYGKTMSREALAIAGSSLAALRAWDMEPQSVFFQPAGYDD